MAKSKKEAAPAVEIPDSADEGEGEGSEQGEEFAVESILRHQVLFDDRNRSQTLYTIKWQGFPHDDNTEEPIESLEGGAEDMLDAYRAAQEALGVQFYADGTKKSKMENYEYKKPRKSARPSEGVLSNGANGGDKRKKRESQAARPVEQEEEEVMEEEAPPKKKKKKHVQAEEEELQEEEERRISESPAPVLVQAQAEKPRKARPSAAAVKESAPVSNGSTTSAPVKVSKKYREKAEEEEGGGGGKERLQPTPPPAKTHNDTKAAKKDRKSTSGAAIPVDESEDNESVARTAGASKKKRDVPAPQEEEVEEEEDDANDTLAEVRAALPKEKKEKSSKSSTSKPSSTSAAVPEKGSSSKHEKERSSKSSKDEKKSDKKGRQIAQDERMEQEEGEEELEEEEEEVMEPEEVGSALYVDEASWDHLLAIDTVEQTPIDEKKGAPDPKRDPGFTYRWAVRWHSTKDPKKDVEWINNEIARRKFPQRIIDFYQEHLRFKTPAEEEMEMDGDAVMAD